jgi:4-hydroxy-3-polyprenylbenzoate decarboxylase
MVLEGTMSPDPADYEVEGPFGEGSGFYGEARRRPVVEIQCITHRNDPVYRGALVGTAGHTPNELGVLMSNMMPAVLWNYLDNVEIPGVLDVATGPAVAVKIKKMYQGHPRQIAAALWGTKFGGHPFNMIIVVEEDVDIRNPRALWGAMHAKTDFSRGLVVYPLSMGSPIDVSVGYDLRNELEYGAAVRDKLLIDATIDWEKHPIRPEWGNRRYPPQCHDSLPETERLVEQRWKEYGF